jgi:hypothetical protein
MSTVDFFNAQTRFNGQDARCKAQFMVFLNCGIETLGA